MILISICDFGYAKPGEELECIPYQRTSSQNVISRKDHIGRLQEHPFLQAGTAEKFIKKNELESAHKFLRPNHISRRKLQSLA